MMHADWLPVVMQGSFSEIYVIDCDTLRFLQVNPAACKNLQVEQSELLGKTPIDIAKNLMADTLELVLRPLREGAATQATLEAMQVRRGRQRLSDRIPFLLLCIVVVAAGLYCHR